jgi:kynurenine formamidase
MFHRISYIQGAGAPRFPGNPPNRIRAQLSLERGDNCNAYEVALFNHNGTHVDLPNHSIAKGRRLQSYEIVDFVFEKPVLIRLDCDTGQAITPAMLTPFVENLQGRDFLFLKTGFGSRRGSSEYLNNPYLTNDAAALLRRLHGLRALGIDFLSVTNPQLQEQGDQVHRILLDDPPDRKPIMIVEDLDLSKEAVIQRFRRVFVIPLLVEEVDSMPCTVFGEYS